MNNKTTWYNLCLWFDAMYLSSRSRKKPRISETITWQNFRPQYYGWYCRIYEIKEQEDEEGSQ